MLRQSKSSSKTPRELLEELIDRKFSVADNGMVVSSSEANGSVSFGVPAGFGPDDVVELAIETLRWVMEQPDPTDYDWLSRKRSTRIRVSFLRA